MANDDYGIISAHSSTGGDLNIPIAWPIDNPLTDLKVLVVGFDGGVGDVSACDYWNFNAETSVLSVPNELDFWDWYAYVFRAEAAEMLSALTSGAEVRVGDIIAQLAKNVRVLEQLQASEDVSLRTVDAISPLANAVARAGKVLAFGADGNPDLTLVKEDVQGAYDARDASIAAKNDAVSAKNAAVAAKNAAETAQDGAETAQGKAEVAQAQAEEAAIVVGTIKDAVDVAKAAAELAQGKAEDAADIATAKAQQASQSASDAAASDSSALASKNDAVLASQSANSSAEAAAAAQTAAEAAQAGAVAANTAAQGAKADAEAARDTTVAARNAAIPEIAGALAAAKTVIDTWSDQSARFAEDEAKISALELSKVNSGALHFVGGSAATSAIATNAPLSICATIAANFAGTITFGGLTITAAAETLSATDGTNTMTAARSATAPAAFVFAQTQAASKLYIGGNLSASGTLTFAAGAFAATGTGAVSRVKVFNFDMSAADAPYTIADYTAGIDEPPSLKGGFYLDIRNNYAGYIQRSTNPAVAFVDGASLALTIGDEKTLDQYIAWKLPRQLRAGETVKIRGEITLKTPSGSGYYNLPAAFLRNATSWASGRQNINEKVRGQTETIDATMTLSGDAEYVCFYRSQTSGSGAKEYEIVSFEVELDGALLSLADYTVKSGTTQTILDASGNANDAVVSGAVAGTNDAAIGRLIDFIKA